MVRDENVLVITLDERASVPTVVETLSRLESAGLFELRAAATIHRSTDGKIAVDDRLADDEAGRSLAKRHPRLAVLLTVLAGPLDTLLLGNSLTSLAGAVAEPDPEDLALAHLSRSVPPGRTAVVAHVAETDPDAVDRELAGRGGRVARRSLAEVEAEVAGADEAVRSAELEARRTLRDTRARH